MRRQIIELVDSAVRRYGTRDPYEIIGMRKINFGYTERLKDTLGYYAVITNRRFIRINSGAGRKDRLQTAAHELNHDLQHRRRLGKSGVLQDARFFSMSEDALETEANVGAAELLIADEDVLRIVGYRRYAECLARVRLVRPDLSENEAREFARLELRERLGTCVTLRGLSARLGLDVPMVEFKIANLKEKGYFLPIEVETDGRFLKR